MDSDTVVAPVLPADRARPPLAIRGAVLRATGAARPYRTSRPLEILDLQLEGPGPGEILVKIEAAGLCHSDLSVVNGSRVRPTPMLLGHEAAGRVVELGAGVDDLRVGQRVVMAFLPRCGDCAGCHTDGKLPCIPGSAANNAGTLLGGARRLSQDGDPVNHHLGVSAFAELVVLRSSLSTPSRERSARSSEAVAGIHSQFRPRDVA